MVVILVQAANEHLLFAAPQLALDAVVQNKIEHLVAFNELQHQLYNQMLHCQTNDEWHEVEELLTNFRKYAVATGVAGDFGCAVQSSTRSLTGRSKKRD
jgi:hypothetical protein